MFELASVAGFYHQKPIYSLNPYFKNNISVHMQISVHRDEPKRVSNSISPFSHLKLPTGLYTTSVNEEDLKWRSVVLISPGFTGHPKFCPQALNCGQVIADRTRNQCSLC